MSAERKENLEQRERNVELERQNQELQDLATQHAELVSKLQGESQKHCDRISDMDTQINKLKVCPLASCMENIFEITQFL